MSVVYAVPSAPTELSDTNLWVGTPMTWLGADGTEWSLTDRSRGVALKKGVRGLLFPQFTRFSSSSPAVPGSRHKGSRALDREVFWPVKVFSNAGSIEWMKLNRAFWRSFDPDVEGTWTVHHPDGTKRSLQCRFQEVDDILDRNPSKVGWQTYQIRLLADQPFWVGEPVTDSWRSTTQRNYYLTAGEIAALPPGTINYLSSGSDLASATFTNDGDVPAYPVWHAVGPLNDVSVGVEGQTLTIPFDVPDGKAVEIDTHPVTGQRLWYGDWDPVARAVVNRVNRTGELSGDQRFVPIPAGEARKLSLSWTGTGVVIATIVPLYRSAL